MSKEYFELDPESGSVSIGMLQLMHPGIVLMIAWTNLWCYDHGIKPVWTSWMRTKEQDARLGAKSTTHRYRAADLSMDHEHGWTDDLSRQYEIDVNERFLYLGALVKDGDQYTSKPIIMHDNGNGWHAHLQVVR